MRTAINGQVVADFIMDFTNVEGQGAEEYPQWSIHTDRTSNRQAGGVGIVLILQKGTRLNAWFISTSLQPITKQSTKL